MKFGTNHNLVVLGLAVVMLLSLIIFGEAFQKDISHSKGQTNNVTTVYIGQKQLKTLIVTTDKDRAQGLSGRQSLAPYDAMLFVFDTPAPYGFWMKDMLFSIDIIWLDSFKKVVHVKEDARPESYPEIFTPETSAKYVLEVPAGFARENNVKIGSEFSF